MEARNATFLAQPSWKYVPWSKSLLPKLPMQSLLDVVADIPGLLEASDQQSLQDRATNNDGEQSLAERLLQVVQELGQWRKRWEEMFPAAASTVSINSTAHLEHLRLPTDCAARSLWFTQFERAHEIVIYSGALLLLLQLTEKWNIRMRAKSVFADLCFPAGPQSLSQPLIVPNALLTADLVIDEIHCCVSYLLAPQHGRSGVIALYYPLRCW